MQVVETSLADAIISAVSRLNFEIGTPKKVYIDQYCVAECGMKKVKFDLRDLQLNLNHQHGIQSGVQIIFLYDTAAFLLLICPTKHVCHFFLNATKKA